MLLSRGLGRYEMKAARLTAQHRLASAEALGQKIIVEQVHPVAYRNFLAALPSSAGGCGRCPRGDDHGRIRRDGVAPRRGGRRCSGCRGPFRQAAVEQTQPVQHLLIEPGLLPQLPSLPTLLVIDDAEPAQGFALLAGKFGDAGDQVTLQVAGGGVDGCLESVDFR